MKRCCVLLLLGLLLADGVAAEPAPREPSIDEVVQLARGAARSLGPARVAALVRRARLRGLVPELRISADRGLSQDRSSSVGRTSDRNSAAIGDDFSAGATLTFELGRLVFAPDEVRILSIERWLASDLQKLVAEVIRLYFARQALLRELAAAPHGDAELGASIREHEALLDAYTDGGFSALRTRAAAARIDAARARR